jgi:dTDP-4-dehydrorhamnose reductase
MILLLGKNGYISKRFQDFFNYKNIGYEVASIRDENSEYHIEQLIKNLRPKFVINAIGYTGIPNVDSCEDHKEECLFVNVILAERIAEVCKKYRVPLGLVSSGCIYNEKEIDWWYEFSESDFPNFSFYSGNCSWYSGTKALSESIVSKTWNKSYIWRLRMPYNHIPSSKNYISKIMEYPKVWSCPNSLTNIDEFVSTCYYSMIKECAFGTYNIVNPGGISAKEILRIAKGYNLGKESYEFIYDKKEFSKLIKTPRSNCVLSANKIANQGFGLTPEQFI